MCDYSLENVRSRPAAIGDKLVVSSFSNTPSIGFADANDRECAVCLQPGTELAFDAPIALNWPMTGDRAADIRVAMFRQIDTENRYSHHDAIELVGGKIIKVTQLALRQVATVLQLPAVPRSEQAPEQAPVAETEKAPAAEFEKV